MTTLQNSKSVSLLNLILPKESVVKVSSALEEVGAKGSISNLRERFYT